MSAEPEDDNLAQKTPEQRAAWYRVRAKQLFYRAKQLAEEASACEAIAKDIEKREKYARQIRKLAF